MLEELRACLAENKSGYILGDFTYADVPLAIAVRGLCPPGKPRRCGASSCVQCDDIPFSF